MKKYMGFKLVEAREGVKTLLGGIRLYENDEATIKMLEECKGIKERGYKLKYEDGYESWCPKEIFEKYYMQVGERNTITQKMIDDMIEKSNISIQTVNKKTTIVHCVLPNGFTMVESSSCVDPSNYNEEMGAEICIDKIKNQLWNLLGFLLQTAKEGIK